jgi:hypothetical protein
VAVVVVVMAAVAAVAALQYTGVMRPVNLHASPDLLDCSEPFLILYLPSGT